MFVAAVFLVAVAPTTFVNELPREVTVDVYTGDAVWTGCVVRTSESCVLLPDGDAQVKLSGAVEMSAFGELGKRPRVFHIQPQFEDAVAMTATYAFIGGVIVGGPLALVGLAVDFLPITLTGAGIFLAGTTLAIVTVVNAPPPGGHLIEDGMEPRLNPFAIQVRF